MTYNPDLPDCYEYTPGEEVMVRICVSPPTWVPGVVEEFHNSHGWDCYIQHAQGTWRFDQACQVFPAAYWYATMPVTPSSER